MITNKQILIKLPYNQLSKALAMQQDQYGGIQNWYTLIEQSTNFANRTKVDSDMEFV